MAHTIYHDFRIKSSLTQIFAAITEPQHLINWWPLKCSGKPSEGEEYNFFFGPEYDWYGKVIQIEDERAFHIKMTASDPDWDPTSFGFDLEPVDDEVQVRFWHSDWLECNAHFRTASFCWAMLLNGLKDYVEHGKVIPFEDRS